MCAKAAASSAGDCLTEADVDPFVRGDGFGPAACGRHRHRRLGDRVHKAAPTRCAPGYSYPRRLHDQPRRPGAIQIPIGCLLPQGVDNLLDCGAISATTWRSAPRGSRRAHPVGHRGRRRGRDGLLRRSRSSSVEALQAKIIERGGKLDLLRRCPRATPALRRHPVGRVARPRTADPTGASNRTPGVLGGLRAEHRHDCKVAGERDRRSLQGYSPAGIHASGSSKRSTTCPPALGWTSSASPGPP